MQRRNAEVSLSYHVVVVTLEQLQAHFFTPRAQRS